MKILKLQLICFLLGPFLAQATLSLGTYVPNSFKAQSNKEGSSTIIALNPFISLDYKIPFSATNIFNPEVGFVYHLDVYDKTSKQTIFLLYNMEYNLSNTFILRYGFGTFMTSISGKGEAVTLNNGATTTDFYTPNGAKSSYTSSLNLGLKLNFIQNWPLRLDTHIMRFASSRRSVSYLLSLNYQ